MNREMHNVFVTLVRLGIGHVSDVGQLQMSIPPVVDWDYIWKLAQEQGLTAIVLDGIEMLPEALRPPRVITLRWIGEVLQNFEYRYSDYERAIGELAGFYGKYGIKTMILKGYGLSLNYPNPKHRPCGDIDIWNFGRQKEADTMLSRESGIKIDTTEHHHTVFYWQSYMVENHYDMLITTAAKSNVELESILKELAMDDSNCVVINDEKVYLPSANFNALFLLRHMLMHFAACGINLRIILDWGFFWEKEGGKVDKKWLMEIVDKFQMTSFFNIINAICVDDLGFKPELFTTVQPLPELKERVLNDTLYPEYDWTDAHRRGFFKRLVFKYNRWKAASWKRKLCFSENDWSSFWTSVRSHLLKPSSI